SDTATNTISGTSMATPHVTGVAALFLETNPSASPATVTAAIVNNSTPNKVTSAGTGSPNRLLFSLLTAPPPPTPTPTPPPGTELLLNRGFESGSVNWVATAGVIITQHNKRLGQARGMPGLMATAQHTPIR